MHPNIAYGGGSAHTLMSPIVLAGMLVAGVLVLVLPRHKAICPFLLFTFLTPLDQQFNIGGVHLFAQRIILLIGCTRAFTSKERVFSNGFNSIDKVFVSWAICRSAAFVLLYHDGGAVVNQLGFLWDTFGGYIFLRYLIREKEDIRRVAKTLVVAASVIAACMIYEKLYLKNVFALLMGGDRVVPNIRYGKVRARGVFQQEILAGCFGGTLVTLFLWLWKGGKAKIAAVVGVISSTIITFTCSSSTGVSAYMFGILTLFAWPLRKHLRAIRWGVVIAIVGLALVMKAPVWFLLARVDFVGGSTGWDRANLIDQFVRHLSSWWLVGTNDNANWGDFTWDECNQFVAEGETGGLLTLILFLTLITRCFSRLGSTRKMMQDNPAQAWLVWTLGAVMVAHIGGFFGISYFDQTQVWWFACLAMISVATSDLEAVSRSRIAVGQTSPRESSAWEFSPTPNATIQTSLHEI